MLRRVRQVTREESGERTVDIGLWAESGEAGEGGVDICVDAMRVGIRLGTVSKPLLGEGSHGRRETGLPRSGRDRDSGGAGEAFVPNGEV